MTLQILKALSIKKYTGKTRTVYVGQRYSVKVPKIPFKDAKNELLGIGRDYYRTRSFATVKVRLSLTEMQGPFRGWFANYREAQYSKQLGENVVPTIFSFLGIFNIMPTVTPFDIDRITLTLNPPCRGDLHTFGEPANYGWYKGSVRLLDYGAMEAVHALLKNGESFRRRLHLLVHSNKHS